MNEPLSEELVSWIKKGGEFVESEAPAFAAEVVSWHFWSNGISAFCLFGVFATLLAAGFILLKYGNFHLKNRTQWEPPFYIFAVACAMFAPLALGCGVGCAIESSKAVIAPRVVIVESLKP